MPPLSLTELEEIESERGRLLARLAELDAILARDRAAVPGESVHDACWVLLSSTGLIGRWDSGTDLPASGPRQTHDVITAAVRTSGDFGYLTSAGRVVRADPSALPAIEVTDNPPNLQGTRRAVDLVELAPGERIVGLTSLSPKLFGWALGTRQGVVKRANPEIKRQDEWSIIRLDEGDEVIGALDLRADSQALIFITTDAQLLRFPASTVRPQGIAAGGMAGIKLAPGEEAIFFGAADPDAMVVTNAARVQGYQTDAGSVKLTPLAQFPEKGRATGGVRCQRFLKGEGVLRLGWVGPSPVIAATATGSPSNLPAVESRRDASGVPVASVLAAFGTRTLR